MSIIGAWLCNKCNVEYSPSERHIRKRQHICRKCENDYRSNHERKRTDAGNPIKRKPKPSSYYKEIKVLNPVAALKMSVRSLTRHSIKAGKLVRLACEACHNPKTEAHHDDYAKPLDVRWFCKRCHQDFHRGVLKLREGD